MKISHLARLLFHSSLILLPETQGHPVPWDNTRGLIQARDALGYIEVELLNQDTGGYFTLPFGSQGSLNTLIVDTGSSDTWVYDGNSDDCRHNGCAQNNFFDYSQSTTFSKRNITDPFTLAYLDGTSVSGYYAYDQVAFGSTTLKEVPFAIVTTAPQSYVSQFVGLGFPEYASLAIKGGHVFPSIPQLFKSQGLTKRTAFSYWLNGNSKAGHVIFGGYDKSRVLDNQLFTLKLVQDGKWSLAAGKPLTYSVDFDSITQNGNTVTAKDTKYVALLDTGSTFSYFDQTTYDNIKKTLGATYSAEEDCDVLPCSAGDKIEFQFNFGKHSITVKGSAFIFQGYMSTCRFGVGVIGSKETHISLGIPFFRSAYTIFDQEAIEVQIGQAINDKDTVKDIAVIPEYDGVDDIEGEDALEWCSADY
ncbi:acid protease [Nadsonia fulvescens var. elongata DSM 6958]|uniref:Acid protease n=1 Tax=Nadsonia fulvescens var. elongata DSM 6958 TaxID=857566 RepID=A0A1E3PIU6_9ASCO|nr:acid protease [Nadsonia fulvescens var. elongata DSM 6958]